MSQHNKLSSICVVGIDLAKTSFQLHGIDHEGKTVLKKKLTRNKFKEFIVQLPRCLVAMEACGGAHYWARSFEKYGHEVKLIAPQFVKPFVKSNKNDAVDAEAICEAVQRPNMRFVSHKTLEQQDIQSIHRIRSNYVARRTALINQMRGLLLEYGIEIPRGSAKIREHLPLILEDAGNSLTFIFRELVSELYDELQHLDMRIAKYEQQLENIVKNNDTARNLLTIPGVGTITASAIIASVGENVDHFKNGREFAAWLGLVPRQHSTGGRNTLLGISKRGDVYLRMLIIHGARAAARFADRKSDRTSLWLQSVMIRRHKNIACVALANKIARTIYAILKNGTAYQENHVPKQAA